MLQMASEALMLENQQQAHQLQNNTETTELFAREVAQLKDAASRKDRELTEASQSVQRLTIELGVCPEVEGYGALSKYSELCD
jgi:hypothetical protein